MIAITHVFYLVSVLFMLGFLGVALRRDHVGQLLSSLVMLAAASMMLVAGSRYWVNLQGQGFAVLVGFLALAQLAIGILLMRRGSPTDGGMP